MESNRRVVSLNGFADIMMPFGKQANVTLRGGRQELIFGSQRLVGPNDFTHVARAFDGAAGIGYSYFYTGDSKHESEQTDSIQAAMKK